MLKYYSRISYIIKIKEITILIIIPICFYKKSDKTIGFKTSKKCSHDMTMGDPN